MTSSDSSDRSRLITCRKCTATHPLSRIADATRAHNLVNPQDDLHPSEVYEDFLRYGCRALGAGFVCLPNTQPIPVTE